MITVYSKQNCSKCDEVKEYFTTKDIKFTVKDITHDLITLQDLRNKHPGAGFPVVDFDGEVIAGDVEAIKTKADTLK